MRARARQTTREHRHELLDARGRVHVLPIRALAAHRAARAHALAHRDDERERLATRTFARLLRPEHSLGHERGQRAERLPGQRAHERGEHAQALAHARAARARTRVLEAREQRGRVDGPERGRVEHAREQLVRALLHAVVGERAAADEHLEQVARLCAAEPREQQQEQVERRARDARVALVEVRVQEAEHVRVCALHVLRRGSARCMRAAGRTRTASPATPIHAPRTSPTPARASRSVVPKTLNRTASQLGACVRRNATFRCACGFSSAAAATFESTIMRSARSTAGRRSGWPYRSWLRSCANSGVSACQTGQHHYMLEGKRAPTSGRSDVTWQYPTRPAHTCPMSTLQTFASAARPAPSAALCSSNRRSLSGTK
jgi:hypothetical protein